MTICERMFSILENRKSELTQTELSRILGLSSGQMTLWKQRNTDPPAKYIIQISEYLGVTPYFLLSGIEDIPTLSDDEKRIISKYRTLDEDGMDAVRGVLLDEQRRVESEKGMASDAVS